MKKLFMFLAVIGFVALAANDVVAQTNDAAAQELLAGAASEAPVYQQIKAKFIDGGVGFMAAVLLCLILGLAVAIERIIYLSLSTTNTSKLIAKVEEALNNGGVQAAQLETGLTWLSLFIAMAPNLGFLGTVIGMIGAFDAIQAAGDISPIVVASGIKVALITTVAGLIVALILQVFFNYITSKVESLVITMEDASVSLIDILVKAKK